MKRRNALTVLSTVVGGSLAAPAFLLSGCRVEPAQTYLFFTEEEIARLEQIAETILPATPQSPGAKDVDIGTFLDLYVADCLDPAEQAAIRNGLVQLDQRCQEQNGHPFLKLPNTQQHDILFELDQEAEAYQKTLAPGTPNHYFALLKNMTLLGYFTSEAGATQALRYVPVPGKYEGDITYEEGDKAWAL